MMHHYLESIRRAVLDWPGMNAQPHRFGGTEFNLGSVEVGHFHQNGMVDIPFNSKLRDQLIAEGRAEPHHLLRETGWISFYVRSEADVERAIWLFRLSYLFNATRGSQRAALKDVVDVPTAVSALQLSQPLAAVFQRVTGGAAE